MLDEEEFNRVLSHLHTKEHTIEAIFADFLLEYERLTGVYEINPNAVFHHKLSLYGPPCIYCGRPLRTRRAKLCGSCMKPVP
jgi:hypothetical protein